MTEEAELMGLLSSLWYLRDSSSLGLLPDSMSLGHLGPQPEVWPNEASHSCLLPPPRLLTSLFPYKTTAYVTSFLLFIASVLYPLGPSLGPWSPVLMLVIDKKPRG